MVQVDGADDANLPTLLVVELFCNGLIGSCTTFIHIDHSGVGFFAGSNGSCGRSGVGSKRAGVVGHSRTGNRKVHKAQIHRTVQYSTFTSVILGAGQSLFVIVVSDSTQIIGSGLELRIAHTIADE